MLRIFPALTVEVILSAIILGLIFSTLPFLDYITHPEFLRYFGNIFGIVSFTLPGVFAENPVAYLVNINLWTLPAEFYCYLVMAALMLGGLVVRRSLFLILFAIVTAVLVVLSLTTGFAIRPSVWSTPAVVYCFFMGMAFFQWRDHVPMNPLLFVLSTIAVVLMIRHPSMAFLIPLPLTYLIVYAGHIAWLSLPVLKSRDYSYGVYLYGFPITQAVVASVPDIDRTSLILVALPLTIAVAALSWHWIEKPFLRLKRKPAVATAGILNRRNS